jgi:hypothetical protein
MHLVNPGEVFPHAVTVSRDVDMDHPDPYQPHGPPGQTGTHNAAPLGRGRHRAKTHGGHRLRQLDHGEYLWRTPRGLHRLVDHCGTHLIDERLARGVGDDCPSVRHLARIIIHHRAVISPRER